MICRFGELASTLTDNTTSSPKYALAKFKPLNALSATIALDLLIVRGINFNPVIDVFSGTNRTLKLIGRSKDCRLPSNPGVTISGAKGAAKSTKVLFTNHSP